MEAPLRFSRQPELQNPSFIVGWSTDAGRLGTRIINYLNNKLSGQPFCEIEPVDFFPLRGVAIDDNIVQFPESEFYTCPNDDLLLFKSTPPGHEWYKYLSLVLDIAENHCHVKELYVISGMVSLGTHNGPRQLWGTCNTTDFKNSLSSFQIIREMDFVSPPRQRPTLNSFLLWAAKRRNIPAASLMIPIPFYLVAVGDPVAEKKVLDFFSRRLNLGIEFDDLDGEIRQQNQMIDELRNSFPDIDESIRKLETNIGLSEEESQRLVKEIDRQTKENKHLN